MPKFTAPLPQETIPADLDMEFAPKTNILAGGALSAYNQFFGPGAAILNFAQEGLTYEMDPGKHLTSKEYEESEFKVPGLSFPNGVAKNVAKIRYSRAKDKERRENLINDMPPGFLSGLSRNVGALVGMAGTFTLDPIASVAAKTTTSLASRMAPWILTKLEGTAATLTARAGIGFAEASVAGAPIVAAQYENDRELGQDHGVLSILTNSATFGLFGAGLRLGFGFDRGVVTPEEHRRAQDVAINQLMNGKPAYTEPVIKNGAYQMAKESTQFLERSGDMIEELPFRIKSIDDQIELKSKDLAKESQGRKDIKDISDIDRGNEFVQRLDRMRSKPSEFLNEEEKNLSRRFTSQTLKDREPTILKKIFDITEKSPIRRSREEQDLLDDFVTKKEPEVISKEIDKLEKKRDELIEDMKEAKTQPLKTKLKFKIAEFNDRIKRNSDHLENISKIDKLEKDNQELFKLRGEINQLKSQKDMMQSTLDANKIYSINMNSNQSPVTENELRSYSAKVQDWRSDFAYSEIAHSSFEKEIESIPEDVQFDSENSFNELKDLRDSGDLSSEVEDFLDEVEKDDKDFESVSGYLKNFFYCLLKRGRINDYFLS